MWGGTNVPRVEQSLVDNELVLGDGKRVRFAFVVEPTQIMNDRGFPVFEWPMVELRPMPYGGIGVFALEAIWAGATFPHLGTTLREPEGDHPSDSHAWTYDILTLSEMAGWRVDGRPTSMCPHKNIGSFGLALTMLVNEDLDGVHTCVFSDNSLMVAIDLKPGDQLTAYYGEAHERIRNVQNYSLMNNKNLFHHYELIDPELGFQGFQADYLQRAILKWLLYIRNLEFDQLHAAVVLVLNPVNNNDCEQHVMAKRRRE
jgi:hypothetical protein